MITQISIIIPDTGEMLMWCEERIYSEKIVRVVYDSFLPDMEEPFWEVSERTYLR
jgi:hypothetical protein